MNKIYFVSKEVSNYLESSKGTGVKLINVGILVFQRNQSKFSNTECIYRVVQDGVYNILPYMGKRVVTTNNIEILKSLITNRINSLESFNADKNAAA